MRQGAHAGRCAASGRAGKRDGASGVDGELHDAFSHLERILSVQADRHRDARVVVEAMEHGKKQFFDFQIKPNTTSELANLKFEPTASGASKARLGKTPLDKLATLLRKYKVGFINNYKNYPHTLAEFNDKQSIKYAKESFDHIKAAGVDVGGCKNSDEFVKNMQKVFTLEPHIATSKLMQVNFLYHVTKLPKEKMDSLFTDMSFLAQKKGREFGPFGKLY